jgi:DNA-binding CsgD family transcriptional regulator
MNERMSKLSPREYELVRFVLKGYSNRNIAEAVGISPNTVKTHMSNVFNKLEVSSKEGLINQLLC